MHLQYNPNPLLRKQSWLATECILFPDLANQLFKYKLSSYTVFSFLCLNCSAMQTHTQKTDYSSQNWHKNNKNQSWIWLIVLDLWSEVKWSFFQSIHPSLSDCSVQSWSDVTCTGSRAALSPVYIFVLWATQWGTQTSLDSERNSLSIALNPEDQHHININHFKLY